MINNRQEIRGSADRWRDRVRRKQALLRSNRERAEGFILNIIGETKRGDTNKDTQNSGGPGFDAHPV